MSTCNKKSHWTRAMQCSKLTTCLYILQRTYRVTSRVRDQTILFANLSPCRIFEQELFWIWRLQQNLVHNTNVARTTPKWALIFIFLVTLEILWTKSKDQGVSIWIFWLLTHHNIRQNTLARPTTLALFTGGHCILYESLCLNLLPRL